METENQPQEAKKEEPKVPKPEAVPKAAPKEAPKAPAKAPAKPLPDSVESASLPGKPGSKPAGGKLAVILIRNITQSDKAIRDTIKMLNLNKKLTCRVVENNPVMFGMLKKVKDYTTFGEIDAETLKTLEEKRGVQRR
jgi:ribosomal protein L30/L7E